MGENDDEKQSQAGQLFENFVQATTCKGTLQAFNILTRQLELDLQDHRHFYSKLKSKVTSWKAKALWNKLDKRYGQKEYKKGKACLGTKCLIIGGGPCGLRLAIELACLGAKVVVVEKRDTFSRNNVLHLWPYTIHDLRCLGAKKFYGKFCAGAIDHISIWQLQLMLFKIALLHGVEIHVNVEFVKLLEPPEDQENQKVGWRAEYLPQDHPLSDYEFDAIIGADGRRNTLEGFRRKEFRGKLAIAITANFVNRNTTAEAKVEEISGVAFIFNQKFFQDLKEETGIDLENIVYYKDSTHYFVMTAKKQSLLDKGVILNDNADAEALLCAQNVDQDSLQSYAREAADFATNYQLPSLDFAINHYEQPDVAMFDFTSMYASENAALVRERRGHHVLVALVGDSLLEPFWPMGTGCARGFLAAFDTAWMVKSWAQGTPPLEVLAERESIYRLLPQTTPENISKNFDQYTIDPASRYPNLNSSCVRGHQVRHLYITNELQGCPLERVSSIRRSVNLSRHESDVRPNRLLTWCQKQTEGYRNVNVTNLTGSWRNGLALCAIIHHFRPELLDFDSLNEDDAVRNNQLAFDIAEKEFGISPITSAKEMASNEEPDKLSMVLYLSKFYELFRGTPLRPVDSSRKVNENNGEALSSKPSNLILNNYLNLTLPRKRVPKNENKTEENDLNKRRRRTMQIFEEMGSFVSESIGSGSECSDTKEVINQNKVRSMATQLLAKFEENAPNTSIRRQATVGNVSSRVGAVAEVLVCLYMSDHKSKTRSSELSSPDVGMTEPFAESPSSSPVSLSQKGSLRKEFPPNIGGSDTCYFCKKRVYVVERLSAEGHFFHRECFKCSFCSTVLRLGNYVFNMEEGKFYCQPHFMHSFSNNKQRKRRTDSKLQDEDKTWKKEEARAAEIMTDSPYSSSEDSSPDEPTSPKKSRSDSAFSNFKRRNSTVSTEWKAVRIGPGEEAAENNLTAVRVMVLSDESSSDKECAPEENHGRIHRRRLSSRKKERSSETQKDSGHPSTAIDALNRASNHPTVSPNKSQRWRKKIQSTFPLLIGRRSSHVTRDGSPTALSSPDDEVFNNNIPEHFLQPHLAGQSYKAPGEDYPDIPSYVPHYKALSSNHVAPKHSDYGAPRTLYPNSTYQYPNNPLENPSEYFTDHRDVFEKEERKDERNKQDLQRHEPNKLANPTLKKLVLSNEEKSNLLDWNSANPRQTQNFHEQPSYVNHDPGGEAESKPKSAFSILSSAIKRSFLRSVGSTSESPKPAAKPKPATPTNYFDIPSTFFRRSFSNSDPQTDPHDTEMNFLSYRSSTPRGDSRTSKEGPSWNSSQRSNISSKVEDMPKMLERFTLRENDRNGAISDIPFRNRKDSIFSSLRSITRPSENPSSAFSNDSWYVPWAIRRKANEKEAEERPRASSVAASSLLSVPHPEMKNRVAKSENYSSSSEDDLPYARSSPFKNSPVSKQRRRMERDARLRAKQEELKRLHKAQTIQRQLQETEEKQRALEIQGVRLEKALRGEADAGAQDEAQLLHEWFQLALEKSKLNRYESELLCVAKELDLEDKQGRLEQQLRERMMIDRALKDEKDIEEEDVILAEMMRVIEQRDQLVTRVDEQRLREATEEADRLAKLANPFARGHQLNLGVMSNRRII
ncbi:F-actin-monooxygenase MICAL2-like isoform X5 [Rana temporaria]|uniref:F-actin-monooxygenase MICAL2-like isoform X5 n=1 Tax=Rana temporaria TaxID=8407 RepID=UPI001AACD544|nr:F-actin-monooxygenase MICAL2-like isoform X5 [Rana temporaria]